MPVYSVFVEVAKFQMELAMKDWGVHGSCPHSNNPEFEMAAYFLSIKYNDPNTQNLSQITVKISKISKMPYQIDQKLPKQGVKTPKFTQN